MSLSHNTTLLITGNNGMKRIFSFLTVLSLWNLSFSQIIYDSNWCDKVNSVFLSPVGEEMSKPFIHMPGFGEQGEQLMLRFDILDPQPQMLRYRIFHCDLDWHPDSLPAGEFISGSEQGDIEHHQSSFNTRQDYVNYFQIIPGEWDQFIASGNYIVEVFPSNYPDSILFTRRFCVSEEKVDIDALFGKPSAAFGNIFREQEINLSVTPRKGSFLQMQTNYYHVFLQQNNREDNRRKMPSNGYSGNAISYQWQAENVFAGGNNFRYFDLSNLWAAMYHVQRIEQAGGQTFAFLQPEEDRSRKAYSYYASLNGGMKINVRDRENPNVEADYVWVNFSLPMERPYLNGNIFIVGDLTQWRLGENSRMEWQPQYHAYTKRMLLKQGYYAYQLLFLPTGDTEALTATLEGDHYSTGNNYTVFVYYRAPGARYDRLVGIRQLKFTP